MKKMSRTVPFIFVVMIIASNVFAEVGDASNPISIMISEFPPCVIVGEKPSGFDIEIWEAIAKDNGWSYKYDILDSHLDVLNQIHLEKADVGIASFTITSSREEKLDFSHHYFDSGLRILILKEDPSIFDSAVMFWDAVKKPSGLFVIFLILFSHIIWILEKDNDPDNDINGINDSYFPGIFEAIYFCIVTCSTVGYGDYTPKKWLGRVVGVALIFAGIIAFCNFTAILSSEYTTEKFAAINSVEDLKGKIVITQTGTPAVDSLKKLGAIVKEVPTIGQACDWLMLERGDALVFDSPIIVNYAQKYPNKVQVVGDMFDKQYYGFALQKDSPLRESINHSLLKIRESGKYEEIYKKWFKEN